MHPLVEKVYGYFQKTEQFRKFHLSIISHGDQEKKTITPWKS